MKDTLRVPVAAYYDCLDPLAVSALREHGWPDATRFNKVYAIWEDIDRELALDLIAYVGDYGTFWMSGGPEAYPDGKRLWDWATKAAKDRGYRLVDRGVETFIVPISGDDLKT